MAEAFVKTFKRDYVRVSERGTPELALSQIAGWFEDYDENHPHQGLRMKSPGEFIRSHHQSAACPA